MAKRYPADGFTRATVESDLVPGVVLRMVGYSASALPPFSDSVIEKVEDGIVYLLRPIVWSNGKVHVEKVSLYTSNINYLQTVLNAAGEPYTMIAATE